MKKYLAIFLFFAFGCGLKSQKNMDNESNTLHYLALGDSYTIGTKISYDDAFPNQIKSRLANEGRPMEVKIIAENGWKTFDLERGIKRSTLRNEYDLVSLLIGVNNQYDGVPIEDYKTAFTGLLESAISLAGNDINNVFVVSIPNYGYTPFGEEKKETITEELEVYNSIAKSVCEDLGIDFYNITPISVERGPDPEFVAVDQLHPSAKQYALWVDSFYEKVKAKLD